MEFWPYISGIMPQDMRIELKSEFASLYRSPSFAGPTAMIPEGITSEIQQDAARVWEEGRAKNPQLSNSLKPIISSISDGGRVIRASLSDYQSSFWIKNKLNSYAFETQANIAGQFPFLNVGLITLTSDGKLLIEQRPEGFTASEMLLNYPCGYASNGDRTLADVVDSQCEGELGFDTSATDEAYGTIVKSISAIGMQRESAEWTPNYVFVMRLNIPYAKIKPTRETKHLLAFPADPRRLADSVVELYSPATKGNVKGKLIPNATGMLALYIRKTAGESEFLKLVDGLIGAASRQGHELKLKQYTPKTNPFQ